MKQYNINVLLYILLFLGIFSCEKQKTWEELSKELKSLYERRQFEEAEEVAREQLKVAKAEKADKKNLRIAGALFDLGNILFSQQKYNDALKVYQEELEFEKKNFGAKNLYVASTLGMIGGCYYKLENFSLALSITQQSFDMYKNIVPDSVSPIRVADYSRTLILLGNIYLETDRFIEAEPYFSRLTPFMDSLSVIPNQIVVNDIITAAIGLASIYVNTPPYVERYRQADTLLTKVGIYCSKDPVLYIDALTSGMDVGAQLYNKLGEYSKAEEMYKTALNNMTEAGEGNSPKMAYLMSKLGRLYIDMKQYGKADSLLQESLRRYRQLGAGSSLQVGTILHNIGANYMAVGEYSKAEQSLQEAIDIYSKAMGADYPKVIMYLEGLETIYYKWGKEEQALATRERINKIRGLKKSI